MEEGFIKELSSLLNQIFLGTPLYKWGIALLVLFIFLFMRKIFSIFVLKILRKLVKKTKTTIDDKILKILIKPVRFLFVFFGIYFSINILGIHNEITDHLFKTLLILTVFWLVYNSIHVFESEIYRFAEKFGKELSREVGSFLVKSLKTFVVVLGGVAILQEWGIDVTAFVASLGLGGLALALAAKDTAANLFGGLTILADKSLKIGDWIKVGSVEGIVEDIGLRTTKIRTFEKSLLTVPNSYIANNPIENFSRRNIRRIKMTVGIVYDTPKEKVIKIVEDIRDMLKNHPGIDKNQTTLVFFDEFGDSSLNIFIYTFTNTSVWQEYMAIKEDINLKIMEIIENNGSSFAFPSRSVYIEKVPKHLKFLNE